MATSPAPCPPWLQRLEDTGNSLRPFPPRVSGGRAYTGDRMTSLRLMSREMTTARVCPSRTRSPPGMVQGRHQEQTRHSLRIGLLHPLPMIKTGMQKRQDL